MENVVYHMNGNGKHSPPGCVSVASLLRPPNAVFGIPPRSYEVPPVPRVPGAPSPLDVAWHVLAFARQSPPAIATNQEREQVTAKFINSHVYRHV